MTKWELCNGLSYFFLAGELGLEPRLTESESAVLPLDDSPIQSFKLVFGLIIMRPLNNPPKPTNPMIYLLVKLPTQLGGLRIHLIDHAQYFGIGGVIMLRLDHTSKFGRQFDGRTFERTA